MPSLNFAALFGGELSAEPGAAAAEAAEKLAAGERVHGVIRMRRMGTDLMMAHSRSVCKRKK